MLAVVAAASTAVIAPNTSLATVPCAYFGGNYAHRGQANIEMLSKMRIIMIEKWEGHCWQDCLGNGTGSPPCQPSCGVENDMLDTFRRVKTVNPATATVLYFNTLLAFPFYTAVGKFKASNALTIDSSTHEPINIRNDNGMEGIGVYGFDTEVGVKLYIDTVKNLTATGLVDGFFGDKWGHAAQPDKAGQWQLCNHECGNVTQAQGRAWNAGKAKALAAAIKDVGIGPYFSNGEPFEGVEGNLNGHWQHDSGLFTGDPRKHIEDVQQHLVNHTYFYSSCTIDEKWYIDPNDPASLYTQCDDQALARFLLAVEKGVFLGSNGWDPAYDKPLGDPLSPAVYTPGRPATLHRNFSSGTFVVFTYNESGDGGKGEIWWEGKPPPPPTPSPTPAPILCGDLHSTVLDDTWFTGGEISNSTQPSSSACCTACAANASCMAWTWASRKRGTSPEHTCHLHTAKAERKAVSRMVSGQMARSTSGQRAYAM